MNRDKERAALERLVALLDEAFPDDPQEIRAELRQAGLDPVLVRARLRSFTDRLAGGEARQPRGRRVAPSLPARPPIPLPWVRRVDQEWRVDPAVAAQARDERSWINLDFGQVGFSGGVRVGLFLNTSPEGHSSLTVEWDAQFFHERGWRLTLYHCDEEQPFFQRNIGQGYRGSAILTAEVLGLDPAQAPLQFGFDPDMDPES